MEILTMVVATITHITTTITQILRVLQEVDLAIVAIAHPIIRLIVQEEITLFTTVVTQVIEITTITQDRVIRDQAIKILDDLPM